MKILLAPDKFRGTYSALEVCQGLEAGIRRSFPAAGLVFRPLADGGEGTLSLLLDILGGSKTSCHATGPMGESLSSAEYGVAGDGTVILESAQFCGLSLLAPSRRDPWAATTRGLGEAIVHALNTGHRDFLVGLGGTATLDGGTGMAEALGLRFAWEERGGLRRLCEAIDTSHLIPSLGDARFRMLCDVDNPLLGPRGSVRVFGPQKGGKEPDLPLLEARLESLCRSAAAIWPEAERLAGTMGAGAAGGVGWGGAVFLRAELLPGSATIMALSGFDRLLAESDLVVTGEGSYDGQSHGGKVAGVVVERGRAAGKPVLVAAGRWDGSRPPRVPGHFEVIVGQDLPGMGERIGEWAKRFRD